MAQIWIDADPGVTVGVVGFLIQIQNTRTGGEYYRLSDRPAHTNQSNEPRLYGWCGSWNDVSTDARGMARVERVARNGRALVRALKGKELAAALCTLGYPELYDGDPADLAAIEAEQAAAQPQRDAAALQEFAAVPARRDYKPESGSVPMSELPFVHRPERAPRNASNWHVPPTDDYGLACEIGREYAAHFVQYMKDNPRWVGSNTLGNIAAAIDFTDESGAKGYWVGFFSYLERLIHAQAQRIDVFADVDLVNADYAEIAARRALETDTGEAEP